MKSIRFHPKKKNNAFILHFNSTLASLRHKLFSPACLLTALQEERGKKKAVSEWHMSGYDHVFASAFVCYMILQVIPTLMELFNYYCRGGLVTYDVHLDDTFAQFYQAQPDFYIYMKRFLDRPTSDAAKAYYSYLDWSGVPWDKNIYLHRRQCAKHVREVKRYKPYVYGPFIFNWKPAHDKQWLRGEDAAGYKMPMWGAGRGGACPQGIRGGEGTRVRQVLALPDQAQTRRAVPQEDDGP